MNYMNMKLVKVNGKTREDLLKALATLGEMDADFSGENGIEYLWAGVDENKYESNMEFLLDVVNNNETDKEVIERYIKRWIEDDNYYVNYILDVVYDNNGKAECIALATMS